MRLTTLVLAGLILFASFGRAPSAMAQTVAPPTIHRVTLRAETGVLTVTGTGLGPDLQVSVDGQAVPQLPGATATEVEVLAPATVMTMAGTYRLVVVDPMRRVGDGFVVVGPGVSSPVAAGDRAGEPTGVSFGSKSTRMAPAASSLAEPWLPQPAPDLAPGPAPLAVIEDTNAPYRTALGHQALLSNTNTGGYSNTAIGHSALRTNTTGFANTATGREALLSNSTGFSNTANGAFALSANTTGANNTATGDGALLANTSGANNTATGSSALRLNTVGRSNTAAGVDALRRNSTGSENTASGAEALFANTTGISNTASGYQALRANTTGEASTAHGAQALAANTIGVSNTASGYNALTANTSGSNNTASGQKALASNTTGSNNAAFGGNAGELATTGSYNVFLGAEVAGTAADTNTIRIGLPFSGGVGQNRTFIAGIHGTQLTGIAQQVYVDANGQLGTITPGVAVGAGTTSSAAALEQQVRQQEATIVRLQAAIDDLRRSLAQLGAGAGSTARRK